MNFNKIREYCEERRITIPELATRIGISEPGLYQVLRNKSIKVDVLEKIATVLEVPIWEFFDINPEEKFQEELSRLKKKNEGLSQNQVILKKENEKLQSLTEVQEELKKGLEEQVNLLQQIVKGKEDYIVVLNGSLALYKAYAPDIMDLIKETYKP